MKIIFYMLATAAIFSAQNASAQEEVSALSRQSFKNGLGLHAGAATGLGFSYRYFPEKWGIQVTGIPVFNGDKNYFASSAISVLYKIKEHKKVDLFGYLGNHLIFQRYQEYLYYPDPWPDPWVEPEPTYTTSRRYNVALGVGVNIQLWEILDLSLQAGYGLSSYNNSPLTTLLSGEIGLYYKF
jgi:hypothetical protein